MDHEHIHSKRPNIALMILFSLFFHLIIIFAALFIPAQFYKRSSVKRYTFYEVNLVQFSPEKFEKKAEKKSLIKVKNKLKRGARLLKKEKTIIISKKKIAVHKSKKSSEKVIEEAISRIRTRVKKREIVRDKLEEAILRIKKKISREKLVKAIPEEGLSLRLYKAQIETIIKKNWIYPAAVINPEKKNLEAIMRLKVKKNGEIIKFWFKKKSNDDIFNNSLIKAIEKSNPLPPFPEGYKKRYEEIEIHFSLSELIDS